MKLLLALSISVWLSLQPGRANHAPCQPAEFRESYSVFLKRHLSYGTPSSLNHEAWEVYLNQNTDCEQSQQSFLFSKDRRKVEDICRSNAGKRETGNYCISKNKFTFISVYREVGTCILRNVTVVTKHIIVACDMVDDVCLPTHLRENSHDLVPWQHAPDCISPANPYWPTKMDHRVVMTDHRDVMTDHGVITRAAGQLCLSLTLLGLVFCSFMG